MFPGGGVFDHPSDFAGGGEFDPLKITNINVDVSNCSAHNATLV